jgi:hypothetical protein
MALVHKLDDSPSAKIAFLILFFVYFIIFCACLYRIIRSFIDRESNIKIRIFYYIILAVCVMRIVWFMDIFVSEDSEVFVLLQIIPDILLYFLGTSFCYFWMEIYILTDPYYGATMR